MTTNSSSPQLVTPQYLISSDGEGWCNLGNAPERNDTIELAKAHGWFMEDALAIESGIEAQRMIAMRHQERMIALGINTDIVALLANALLDDINAMVKSEDIGETFPVVCVSFLDGNEWTPCRHNSRSWPEGQP